MNPNTRKELFDSIYDALLSIQRISEQVSDIEVELNKMKEILVDEFGDGVM